MTATRQPLLHDETVVLRAPSQAWSAVDGSMGSAAIHGLYFSDVRVLSALTITVGGEPLEHIATLSGSADATTFVSLARQLDDPTADPGVRVEHTRTATTDGVVERLEIHSRLDRELRTEVLVSFTPDATGMDAVKAGSPDAEAPGVLASPAEVAWAGNGVAVVLRAVGASIGPDTLGWAVTVPARGRASVEWSVSATDSRAAVHGAPADRIPWSLPGVNSGDERLARWTTRALQDLDGLRLMTPSSPGNQFLAAGAPWFFTLFGRDSIWAARFMLPLGTRIAADTLRVLARLQGSKDDPETAEEPGKIMHELRRGSQSLSEGFSLPPLYYGTVDATALWVCLLHDAWRWGMPDDEVWELLPHLQRALEWMRDHGDSDGDGLLEYVDHSGRGLSNQGWKDSGDSVQWRDGTLATGPIALCEVQAYAFEAAMHGADLLDAFGIPGEAWREWAAELKRTFHEKFWIDSPDGAYVAIALDADKRPVDTVTSNLGHLLGTGLLDDRQAALIARRLVSPELNSGYGLRTMSTNSTGYWPLGYHAGSVWTHDTAIAIAGLARDGFRAEAAELTRGLLAAASAFDYRMPELHSGDPAIDFPAPVPYPAACRPQAWSAAAAISVLGSTLGLAPNAQSGELGVAPSATVGAIRVDGLVFGGVPGSITTNADGEVTASTLPLTVG